MSWLSGQLIGLALRRNDRKLWGAMRAAAKDPQQAQQETLTGIVGQHRNTTYGRAHGFGEIRTAVDFAEAVPVNSYVDLQPHIEAQERNDTAELTDENPVLYAQTSGTTGTPKYVPITPSGIERQKAAQRLLASMVSRSTNVFAGRILGIGSPAVEGHLPSGKPYGSASGVIFDGMPAMVRSRYVLTDDIIAIKDHEQRYYEIARAGLTFDNVRAIATANPSTFLRLHRTMIERWDELAADIGRVDAARGRELAGLRDVESLPFDAWWPELEVVTSWTGGSCGLALERLAPMLPDTINMFELGYSASELRGSVTTGPGRSDGVPLLRDVYYEFVARDDWEADNRGPGNFVGLGDLETGRQYYIFITTIDGLYRYDMNDIVEAVDMYEQTPTITFVQKGRGVTNITGEKVYESQLIAAVQHGGGGGLPGAGFFLGIADAAAERYSVYVEGPLDMGVAELAERIDRRLGELNIEYAAKRASGRLEPIEVLELRAGSADAYRRHCTDAGQRDAQFKVQYLQTPEQCDFDLVAASVQ